MQQDPGAESSKYAKGGGRSCQNRRGNLVNRQNEVEPNKKDSLWPAAPRAAETDAGCPGYWLRGYCRERGSTEEQPGHRDIFY